jgi:parvulin-like peptidyl-prolyl isomerase
VRNVDILKDKQKELYAAARKLKAGGLSGVIKTSDGLHIIKLKTYSPERQLSFDEARGSLEGKFRVEAQQKRLEEWGRELRTNAKIELEDTKIEITESPKKETKEITN